jgi:transposase
VLLGLACCPSRQETIQARTSWTEAFKHVKANQGAAGVDGQSIAEFEVGSPSVPRECAVRYRARDQRPQYRAALGDVAGLLALIARKQTQAKARLGRTIRVLSCYDAGYDGIWLNRSLSARGIHNRILDAASILVDRRSRRAKTDRLDAAGLLRTLMALDRRESQVCRVVRVPSVAQEDARRRSRERTRLLHGR